MSAIVRSPRPRRRALAAAFVPALLALAACGTTTQQAQEPASSVSSAAPRLDLPVCADTWVAGKQLPAGYKGCQDDGTAVEDVTTDCSMGNALVQHGTDLYATPGRQVRKAEGGFQADPAFQRIYELCTG